MAARNKAMAVFKEIGKSIREIAAKTGIPKSTVFYHQQNIAKRTEKSGTDFWESGLGLQFIARLVVATIYTFAIKSGNGAGRCKEFFTLLGLNEYIPSSETTILRTIRRIESLILEYRALAEAKIHSRSKEIELILGVDETWFDKMYLVCQELSSGYIFFETEAGQRDANTWNGHIKKTL